MAAVLQLAVSPYTTQLDVTQPATPVDHRSVLDRALQIAREDRIPELAGLHVEEHEPARLRVSDGVLRELRQEDNALTS